jgi:tripartite-type tricarboxylate transporter receptor subunit TctC
VKRRIEAMKNPGRPLGGTDSADLEHSLRALMQILRAEEVLHQVLVENVGGAGGELWLGSEAGNRIGWGSRPVGALFRN